MNLDFRTMEPKPFMEIFPTTISLSAIAHVVSIGEKTIGIPGSEKTAEYTSSRPLYETSNKVNLDSFGPVESEPLGSIVHARSGDKANNSNIGKNSTALIPRPEHLSKLEYH